MEQPPPVLPSVYVLGYKTANALTKLMADVEEWRNQFPSTKEILSAIARFPVWYKEWWLTLFKNDPVHVIVETTLLVCILFFVFARRSKDWQTQQREKLTAKEEAELLQEWKEHGRQPLTPQQPRNQLLRIQEHISMADGRLYGNNDGRSNIVVHKSNGRFLHIEDVSLRTTADVPGEVQQVLNFATFDFLGMSADSIPDPDVTTETTDSKSKAIMPEKSLSKKKSPQLAAKPTTTKPSPTPATESPQPIHPVKEASLAALDRYGCGSCGPRGFYGTIDVHLELEKAVADFCGTDDAILYSDGASTVSSTIAAFCKRGDLLVVDEAVYEPIRTGVQLSRANVKYFAHNDMEDLRRVLTTVQENDRRLGRKLNAQRRFIVVEGLYKNTGNICPLADLVQLKHEFKYRLILDESFSFGTLGATGRGVTELYDQRLMYDAEIVMVSLENSLGSIGALTVGTEEVVDHQRLSGSGYCFSASSPPFTATAALAALELLQSRPDATLRRLQENRAYLNTNLQRLLHDKLEDLLLITSDERSPIVLLQVAEIPETEYLDEVVFLQEVVRESLVRGIAFVATGATTEQEQRATDPPPGIRMTVSAAHCKSDIDKALVVLGEAVDVVMSRFYEEEES